MNLDAKLLSSHRTQLTLTALVSGVVVGSTILAFQRVNRLSKVKNLKDSIPKSSESVALTDYGAAASTDKDRTLAASALRGDWDEDLIAEQLSRNATFLGTPGLAAVRSSIIIVVGCGGVGSWAATMLVRSGVGKIRLIDFDQVSLSSLNRHAVATLADVGTPKVHALKSHLAAVAPWVEIDARNELWTLADAETLLEGNPTWVVDAIDNIATKVDLLAYCHSHGLKVISAMGAGCKSDPTRIQIGDISESFEDPLSRSTRRRLRQKGITTGIPTVYSTEKPGPGKAALLPLSAEEFAKGGVDELAPLPEFRVRILPVLGTMPGVFGLCVANHVIASIAGYPLEYSVGKSRGKLYEEMIAQLAGQESRLRGNVAGLRVPLREEDAGYVVEEVFKGRSVVSGYYTRLVLTRWEALPEKEDGGVWGMEEHRIGIDGVVVMTKDEAKKHEKEVLKGRKSAADVWGPEVVARVEERRKEEAEYAKYR
ncbi:hypothetical protein P167DRAFT_527033 [Morchella conica CCBAS932]|uniref:THIF-type NAD/FAD binding fold domain-containing protein n=1 Tax=Morchella conica CCBAS932 TaxID=1392247 RepID=A0A3N4KJJ1_9PEZI|nr:hypothetical protein P167DRAFT_527033 [Morchella conica CCBAS932]